MTPAALRTASREMINTVIIPVRTRANEFAWTSGKATIVPIQFVLPIATIVTDTVNWLASASTFNLLIPKKL